ncbi:hypothetical protein NHX12_028735 [Muraenolepis orangiensis]|uniref:Uncharacterized protein n=1 Tax=Muraenolepis orangiensis TaxID=630683 RepID=A0A9Q0EAT4_9TELE|nr:hypothetical protein NHX12_028735 [Muraenolepis orangiensis]
MLATAAEALSLRGSQRDFSGKMKMMKHVFPGAQTTTAIKPLLCASMFMEEQNTISPHLPPNRRGLTKTLCPALSNLASATAGESWPPGQRYGGRIVAPWPALRRENRGPLASATAGESWPPGHLARRRWLCDGPRAPTARAPIASVPRGSIYRRQ